MTLTRCTTAAAAALTLVMAPGALLAQQAAPPVEGRGARPAHARRLMAVAAQDMRLALGRLDLSDTQRTQVQEILQRHREELAAAVRKATAARRVLGDASATTPFDEGAIRAAAQAFGESEADLALTRARIRGEVWEVLSPDQRAKADQLRNEMKDRAARRARERAERPRRGPGGAAAAPAAPTVPPGQ